MSAAARRKGISCSQVGLTRTGGARGACGYLFRRHDRRTGRLSGMAHARADGQRVPGCGDREPERLIRPGHADAASRDRPPQRGSMCHRAVHDTAAAYLGDPVPGMALTRTVQARERDYHREAGRRAVNSGRNLFQPACPVRVIFRRHTASVLHHLAGGHTSAVVRLPPRRETTTMNANGRRSRRLQNVKHLHWTRAGNRLPASACRDGRQYRAGQLDVPDDRPSRFTVVPKVVRCAGAYLCGVFGAGGTTMSGLSSYRQPSRPRALRSGRVRRG